MKKLLTLLAVVIFSATTTFSFAVSSTPECICYEGGKKCDKCKSNTDGKCDKCKKGGKKCDKKGEKTKEHQKDGETKE